MGNPFVTITGYDIDDYIDDYIGEPLYMDYIDDYIGDYHNPLTGKPLFLPANIKGQQRVSNTPQLSFYWKQVWDETGIRLW